MGLIEAAREILARERLEAIWDMSAVHDKPENTREYLANLAEEAYSSDHDTLGKVILSIATRGT